MASDSTAPTADLTAALQQAIGLHQQGRLPEAANIYEQILNLQPRHFDALQLLGAIANHYGKFDHGARLIGDALAINPHHAPSLYNHGSALLGLQRYDEALARFDQAVAVRPNYVTAWVNRGNALLALKRPEDAVVSYRQALAFEPANPEVLNNLGTVLLELKRPADVLAMAASVLAADPGNPFARYNRANALRTLKRMDEAMTEYDQVLAIRPDYPEALTNRGLALQDLQRIDEAMADHARAAALAPSLANAPFNEGACRLLKGDYRRGLELYEWRWRIKPLVDVRLNCTAPRWQGQEDISGKTLLIYAEQGYGDTIQACRYVPLLAARGARVVLDVPPPLKPLLQGLAGVAHVVTTGEPTPAVDFHCPIMSLPLAFGTTVDTIPAAVPYLTVPAAARDKWRARLGDRTGPRIGIAWSGNRDHPNDQDRSIALTRLAPLFDLHATFISLQKDMSAEDKAAMPAALRHYGDEIGDFTDTAALTDLMDVVISVDTATAHLAGALGKKTYVLLPFSGLDWRWMLNRADSPWYPTAHLLRQPAIGDWGSVIARLVTQIRPLLTR